VSRCHELKKVDGHLKLPQVIASSPVFHQHRATHQAERVNNPSRCGRSLTPALPSWCTLERLLKDARGTQCTGRSLNPAPAKNWGKVGSGGESQAQPTSVSSKFLSDIPRITTQNMLHSGHWQPEFGWPQHQARWQHLFGPQKNTKNEARHHAANAKWGCAVRMTNPSNIRQAQVHASLANSFVNSKSSSSISLTQPKVDTVQGWRLQYSSRLQLQPETETWAP
jgi:hypothetical protein